MRRVLLFVVSLAACGESSGPPVPRADYYVNEVTGNDGNTGTSADTAFRTITHALSVAVSGDTIQVAPGLYDAANGEVFPLTIPAGVSVFGDEGNKGGGGAPTAIVGGDTVQLGPPIAATINAGANSVVAGFTIVNGDTALVNAVAVYVVTAGVTIRNNRIVDSYQGIHVRVGASALVIVGNVVTGHETGGISFVAAGAGSRVEGNTVTGNGEGVGWSSPAPYVDLGGGSAGSAGGNILSCNTDNDLWVSDSVIIDAGNNRWDHVPPTMGDPGTGLDIYNDNGDATVNMTGASLAPSPCP